MMLFTGLSQNFWVNLCGFQLVWWLTILGRDQTQSLILFLLLMHLLLHARAALELRVVLLCGLLGYAVDTCLTFMGVFTFREHVSGAALPPLWLLLLWFGFCATLRQSLSMFIEKLALAAVCGAVAGSLTYLTAAKLGAVMLEYGMVSTGILLAIIWAVLFPVLLWIADNLGESHAAA